MKRLLSIILGLALLLGIAPLSALAVEQGWYVVDSVEPNGYCYLYSKPTSSDEESRNLGRYDNGEYVYVTGQEGRYYRVSTQDNKSGYISANSLRRYYGQVESAEDKAGWYVVSSTEPSGYCYLYSKPSSSDENSRNLGRYDNGEYVYVTEYYGGGNGKNHYCRVETLDGKTGYIRSTCLRRYNGTVNPTARPTATPRPTARPTVRPTTIPAGELAYLPLLTPQGYGTVRGGNTPVYTGPSNAYYRTTAGRAYVSNGGSLRIYAKEGSYYLIQYAANLNGRSVPRWSFIPASRFSVSTWVNTPDYEWLPISIADDAHISDAPTWTHGYDEDDIDIDRDSAYALARITDADGDCWIYIEAIGYATTSANTGYVSVRGFVPAEDVEVR